MARTWLRVGLRQDREGSLLQDGVPGQVRGLEGDVDVADATVGCGDVLSLDAQVVDGRVQPVLSSAQLATQGRDGVQGGVDVGNGRRRVARGSFPGAPSLVVVCQATGAAIR